ncbi:MAG: beta-lactamase family protein, partial [Ruminococcus sp.]|nr:beta-lactamase family protein [Ruminococcus sp.]
MCLCWCKKNQDNFSIRTYDGIRRSKMKKYRIISLFAAVMVASITALPAIAAEQADNTNETNEKVICIGSVSKMFAATAVMQLAEQGKVDIDAPVTDYLPDFYMADSRYKDITV